MANYDSLINAVKAAVKTNGIGEITGATLQATLLGTIEELTVGFQFMDVATPATSPDSNDKKEFYIGFAGTYANFGSSVTVPEGSIILFKKNEGAWNSQVVKIVDPVRVTQNTLMIGNEPVCSLSDSPRDYSKQPYEAYKIWVGSVGEIVQKVSSSYATNAALVRIAVTGGDRIIYEVSLDGVGFLLFFTDDNGQIISTVSQAQYEKNIIVPEGATYVYVNRSISADFSFLEISANFEDYLDKEIENVSSPLFKKVEDKILLKDLSQNPYTAYRVWKGVLGSEITSIVSSYATNAALTPIPVKEGDVLLLNTSIKGENDWLYVVDEDNIALLVIPNHSDITEIAIPANAAAILVNRTTDQEFFCIVSSSFYEEYIDNKIVDNKINERSVIESFSKQSYESGKIWNGTIGNTISKTTSSYNTNAALDVIKVKEGDKLSVKTAPSGTAPHILICNASDVIISIHQSGIDIPISPNAAKVYINRKTDDDTFFVVLKKKEYYPFQIIDSYLTLLVYLCKSFCK